MAYPTALRALSLIQPYATLMAIGAKRVETRGSYYSFRGPLAIHASKNIPGGYLNQFFNREIRELLIQAGYHISRDALGTHHDLPTGAIVGVTMVIGCESTERVFTDYPIHDTAQERRLGNYEAGRYGLVTDKTRRLTYPVPARGMQGIWPCPPEVFNSIARQLGWSS